MRNSVTAETHNYFDISYWEEGQFPIQIPLAEETQAQDKTIQDTRTHAFRVGAIAKIAVYL